MNSKEIHFYEYEKENALHSWKDSMIAVIRGKEIIKTTQMGLLSCDLFGYGYRIFIHESRYVCYEIKLGTDNERTEKDIRKAHNLFKVWRAGGFSI